MLNTSLWLNLSHEYYHFILWTCFLSLDMVQRTHSLRVFSLLICVLDLFVNFNFAYQDNEFIRTLFFLSSNVRGQGLVGVSTFSLFVKICLSKVHANLSLNIHFFCNNALLIVLRYERWSE